MLRVYSLSNCFASNARNTYGINSGRPNTTQRAVKRSTFNYKQNSLITALSFFTTFILNLFGLKDKTKQPTFEVSKALPKNIPYKEALKEFKNVIEEMQSMYSIESLLDWDLQTAMPEINSNFRAWQMSLLTKRYHELLTSEKMKSLLEILCKEEEYEMLSYVDQALIKVVKDEYEKEKNIPTTLAQELTEVTAKAHHIWIHARETKDFNLFAPILERIITIHKKIAELRGYKESPYNVALEMNDQGMTTDILDQIFAKLKHELVPIVKKITSSNIKIDNGFVNKKQGEGELTEEELKELSSDILKVIGFDFSRGRLTKSAHPFTTINGENDIGITSCYKGLWDAINTALHEGGHGLYDQGINPGLSKTLLHEGTSLGIHESQSRLYETIIGQGLPFWKYYFPRLKEKYPERLQGISFEDFYKALNKVEVIPIRNISDEVTYNLHVIVRYEIEKDFMEGKLEVKDIPKAWNKKMQEYLGITPKDDSEGCLQDVHWACGDIGYFPSYTLGNLYAAQIYNQAKKEIPDLEKEIENGNLMLLREWLREKIHKCGKMQSPDEIILRVTGESLNVDYFINYIKEKYNRIYQLKPD